MKNLTFILHMVCFGLLLSFYGCRKDDSPEKLPGKTFYIDAVNGNDITGNGTEASPYKSFDRVMDTVSSGDLVLMNSGNYGTIVAGRTPGYDWGQPGEIAEPLALFNDWVTFKAAPGQTPHIETLDIGTLNIPNSGSPAKQIDFKVKGNSDLYMRFEGLVIDNEVSICGSRYVQIVNCTISSQGELNGSISIIDNKHGIEVINGRYITLEGNDITHTAIGISAASYDIVIKNNHIHHNSHDGIRILGGDGWLVEGNRIHDLDDGANDNTVEWNRHTDGIHLFQLFDVTTNLTVRGNLFYHLESMGIMMQGGTDTEHNASWTFENNVFGPVGGIAFHLGADIYTSCIFRHNTFVYAPNDMWTSIYGRNMHGNKYTLALWSDSKWNAWYRFYNNILTTDSPIPEDYAFVANNVFDNDSTGKYYEPIPGNIQDFIDQGKTPGALSANSAAIDAGSDKYTKELKVDFSNKVRDNRPDIGAFEK